MSLCPIACTVFKGTRRSSPPPPLHCVSRAPRRSVLWLTQFHVLKALHKPISVSVVLLVSFHWFGCRKLWMQTSTQTCWTSLMLLMAWHAPPLTTVPAQTYTRGGSKVPPKHPPSPSIFLFCTHPHKHATFFSCCFASMSKVHCTPHFLFVETITTFADSYHHPLCCYLGCRPWSEWSCILLRSLTP